MRVKEGIVLYLTILVCWDIQNSRIQENTSGVNALKVMAGKRNLFPMQQTVLNTTWDL